MSEEVRNQQLFKLNRRVGDALGYTVDTQTDEDGSEAIIVSPDGIELQYTLRNTEDDFGSTLEDIIEWAWEDACDPEARAVHEAPEEESLPPLWSTDATAAMLLFEQLEKPKGFKVKVEYEYFESAGKWRYAVHVTVPGLIIQPFGFGDTLAEALCEGWLAYKKMQPQT